jgi:hypothetical protein
MNTSLSHSVIIVYKIITKIIAMRVKHPISKSISKWKYGFFCGGEGGGGGGGGIHEVIKAIIKNIHSVSIIWKEIVLTFPLIRTSLVGRVSDGESMLAGMNP